MLMYSKILMLFNGNGLYLVFSVIYVGGIAFRKKVRSNTATTGHDNWQRMPFQCRF